MTVIIDLTPIEEAQLSAAAKETGLDPTEFVKKLVRDHLPVLPLDKTDNKVDYEVEELDARLRRWQEQDGASLMPDVSTQSLFAQWAAEDAQMSDEEREAEDRLWEDLEKGHAENSRDLRCECKTAIYGDTR